MCIGKCIFFNLQLDAQNCIWFVVQKTPCVIRLEVIIELTLQFVVKMLSTCFAIVLSICLCQSADAFGIRNNDSVMQ